MDSSPVNLPESIIKQLFSLKKILKEKIEGIIDKPAKES